jgi:hypothetical protein
VPHDSLGTLQAVKRIQRADKNCDGIIAHQISDKTFELKRLDQGLHEYQH